MREHLPRLFRFGAVGVVNTGVYYACYLLLHPHMPYLVAHVCAFVVTMILSYFLNCRFTFHTKPQWRTFLLFPLSNVANFAIMTLGLQVAVGELHVPSKIAPLAVALIAIPVTFVVANVIMVERRHGHHVPTQVDVTGSVAGHEAEPAG